MEKIRIQDDLYNYVNQEKLEQLVIPEDKPCVGGFVNLSDDVEKIMIKEFNEMSESKLYPNHYLKNACILFEAAKDVKKKNKHGIKPALKNLAILNKLVELKSLNKMYKKLMLQKIALPFKVSVDTNMKNTSEHCVYIQGPSVILPDASYYKPESAPQKQMLLGVWTNIAKMIISKTDLTKEEQEKYIEDTLTFDEILGNLVKTSEEWSEYVKMYNPMKTSRVASFVKTLNLKKILKANGYVTSVGDGVIATEAYKTAMYIEKLTLPVAFGLKLA